jgi:hypothetical protein
MPVEPNDWRLTNQQDYLHGRKWTWKEYRAPSPSWDHDHCCFCWAKFMEANYLDTLQEGFSTQDDYYWVCRRCFADFKEIFDWTEVPTLRIV